jgi:hypothetical protein
MPIALVKPNGPGGDFVCGPIRGMAMVRRRNAVDRLTIRARVHRANSDRSAGYSIFKARQSRLFLTLQRSRGTEPGPAGFDWVEFDFSGATPADGLDDL